MSLTLVLIRHAKSDWDDPLLDDHDRPLNTRGTHDAPRIGAWLAAQGHVPLAAHVSTARRAVETWDGVASAFPDVKVSYHRRLYHAPPSAMLHVLNDAAGATVAMVGHNPGIAEFAARLLISAPDHPRFADYPTCATLIARFDADDWSDVGFGMGTAVDFITPHDLP